MMKRTVGIVFFSQRRWKPLCASSNHGVLWCAPPSRWGQGLESVNVNQSYGNNSDAPPYWFRLPHRAPSLPCQQRFTRSLRWAWSSINRHPFRTIPIGSPLLGPGNKAPLLYPVHDVCRVS